MNNLKTFILLLVLTGLLLAVGSIWGTGGIIVALVFSLIMNLGVYWFSDKIALSMARAKEVSRDEAPELHYIVEEQARLAGLPKESIQRARVILAELERNFAREAKLPELGGDARNAADLFDAAGQAVLDELRDLDPDHVTPLQAIQILHDFKHRLQEENG